MSDDSQPPSDAQKRWVCARQLSILAEIVLHAFVKTAEAIEHNATEKEIRALSTDHDPELLERERRDLLARVARQKIRAVVLGQLTNAAGLSGEFHTVCSEVWESVVQRCDHLHASLSNLPAAHCLMDLLPTVNSILKDLKEFKSYLSDVQAYGRPEKAKTKKFERHFLESTDWQPPPSPVSSSPIRRIDLEPHLVTRSQIAAAVHLSKRSLEHYVNATEEVKRLPKPVNEVRRGQQHRYRWNDVREWAIQNGFPNVPEAPPRPRLGSKNAR